MFLFPWKGQYDSLFENKLQKKSQRLIYDHLKSGKTAGI